MNWVSQLTPVEILCGCMLVDERAFSCSELYVVVLAIAWALQESAQNPVARGVVSLVLILDSRMYFVII